MADEKNGPLGRLEVIEFDQFDTSFAVDPADEGNARRRYMTLLAEPASPGGTSRHTSYAEVLHVRNTEDEYFALKRLRPVPADQDALNRRGREAALFEEYRNMLAVSQLQGFPRVYGYGVTHEGDPGILMEWVQGRNLLEARREGLLAQREDGGVEATTVAAVGISVLQALASTTCLEGTFVHRDLSPRNVMVRVPGGQTGALDPGALECCVIDLGSALYMRPDEATFTATMDVWRSATPEYAPPEMLAISDRSYMRARRSPKIDVYALCSMLYELYCGHTPYRLCDRPTEDPLKIKTAESPEPLSARQPEEQPLVDAIMSGIAADQDARPDALALFGQLARWQRQATGRSVELRDGLTPAHVVGTRLWTERPTPTPAAPASQAPDSATGTAPARRRSMSRRGFLIGAGCVAVAAAGGAIAYNALRPRAFGEKSWTEISDLASKIAAASSRKAALALATKAGLATKGGSIRTDLTKEITLSDGTSATVQVVDFWHDDVSGGKAGMTFAFTQPVARRNMSGTRMASGGWEQCQMRSWLNDEFWSRLPKDLSKHIKAATKLTNNAGATKVASSVTATSDKLWLFSVEELGGNRSAAALGKDFMYVAEVIGAEGTQYLLWSDQDVSTDAMSNTATRRKWNGKRCYWWTRSPSPDCSEADNQTWFNRVGPNGDVFDFATAATGDGKVTTALPGFCI